jgi:hypothetical protein
MSSPENEPMRTFRLTYLCSLHLTFQTSLYLIPTLHARRYSSTESDSDFHEGRWATHIKIALTQEVYNSISSSSFDFSS